MSAIKTAEEIIETTVNERKLVNMDFAEDLDGDTVASIISTAFVPSGPTFTTAVSGTKAQLRLTGNMQAGTRYRCTILVESTTNIERFEGHGWLEVA